MDNQEAIKTLKANYPDACYEQLREAVDMAISALQEQEAKHSTDLPHAQQEQYREDDAK